MKPENLERRMAEQPFRGLPAEWREGILAAARAERPEAPSRVRNTWVPDLRDIFWPAPRLWAAIACSWAVMLALALFSASRAGSPEPAGLSLGWNLRQQQRLLAELGALSASEPARSQPGHEAFPGQPHSELNPGFGRG